MKDRPARIIIAHARSLRRTMSESERRLWSVLRHFRRDHGLHVRRQAPVGPYFADFYIHAARLIIEVDGEHHQTPSRTQRDARRDAWMVDNGYHVLRLTTGDVWLHLDGCAATILERCQKLADTEN